MSEAADQRTAAGRAVIVRASIRSSRCSRGFCTGMSPRCLGRTRQGSLVHAGHARPPRLRSDRPPVRGPVRWLARRLLHGPGQDARNPCDSGSVQLDRRSNCSPPHARGEDRQLHGRVAAESSHASRSEMTPGLNQECRPRLRECQECPWRSRFTSTRSVLARVGEAEACVERASGRAQPGTVREPNTECQLPRLRKRSGMSPEQSGAYRSSSWSKSNDALVRDALDQLHDRRRGQHSRPVERTGSKETVSERFRVLDRVELHPSEDLIRVVHASEHDVAGCRLLATDRIFIEELLTSCRSRRSRDGEP